MKHNNDGLGDGSSGSSSSKSGGLVSQSFCKESFVLYFVVVIE